MKLRRLVVFMLEMEMGRERQVQAWINSRRDREQKHRELQYVAARYA